MRSVPTRILSAALGGVVGLLTAGLVLAVGLRLFHLAFPGPIGTVSGLLLTILMVSAGFAGLEAFRATFNGLSEHWSEAAVPLRIRPFPFWRPWFWRM